MSNKALLIVDVQIRLFESKKPVYNSKTLLDNINILEKKSQDKNSTVVYIQHENLTTFKYGNPDWHLHPSLAPRENDLFIRKKECNSFFETPLNQILKAREIDSVIVCGLLSNRCVMQTCLGAIYYNYNKFLVSDAHSNTSIKPEDTIKKTNNKLIKSGVNLVATKDVKF